MYRFRCLLGFHVWSAQTDEDGEGSTACQNCGEIRRESASTGGMGNDYPGSWGQRT